MLRNVFAPIVGCLFLAQVTIQTACTYGHGPPEITEGQRFHEERIEQVQVNAPASEVIELLGDPLEIRRLESKEVWRYFVRATQEESVRLFGFIPLPGKTRSSWREVLITLIDDRVTEISVRPEASRTQ